MVCYSDSHLARFLDVTTCEVVAANDFKKSFSSFITVKHIDPISFLCVIANILLHFRDTGFDKVCNSRNVLAGY